MQPLPVNEITHGLGPPPYTLEKYGQFQDCCRNPFWPPDDVAGINRLKSALLFSPSLSIAEMYGWVKGLRTEEKYRDLSETFAMVSAELAGEPAIPFQITLQGTPRDLNPIVCDDACQIGQEALINAFRHSLGQKIETEITFARTELRLRFRDDGCGVDSKILEHGGRPGHWGMTGMRERARKMGARLDIWSRPGAGTEVELRIPASSAYRGGAKGWRWSWSGSPDREGNNS